MSIIFNIFQQRGKYFDKPESLLTSTVGSVQRHVNKCEQRIIPELNGIILLKLRHEYKRKMIQNGSEINAQEKL